jgi:hypothetical protein
MTLAAIFSIFIWYNAWATLGGGGFWWAAARVRRASPGRERTWGAEHHGGPCLGTY